MLEKAVIDLSHHNTIPGNTYWEAVDNLKKAKDAGVVGLIHKATEGFTYVDQTGDNRLALARDAGLLFGTYHFIRPGDPAGQAAFYYNTVQGWQSQAQESQDWLWALDYEDPGVSLNDAFTFMTELEAVTGLPPVLYSGHVLKEKLGGKPDSRFSGYRLWLAQYGKTAALPPGFDKWWLWQYTDAGSVDGVKPPTDLNRYDGSASQLVAEWTGRAVEPKPDKLAVMIDVFCPYGVRLDMRVNGVQVAIPEPWPGTIKQKPGAQDRRTVGYTKP